MKCLVTGATGYIGSRLIDRLISENNTVVGLIHQKRPLQNIKNVTYIQGDIIKDEIKDIAKGIDVIFHCAGIVNDYEKKDTYYKVHINGTKNLIESSKKYHCKKFIFLSHIPYESNKKKYPYQKSKELAESLLLSEYKNNKFPVVIVRPGNVFGPNASTWVNRPIEAIRNNRIRLINKGNGIFLHTYIDNLIDSLILVLHKKNIEGNIFEITDGDNTITWGTYLNDLAVMINHKPLTKQLSKSSALALGKLFITLNAVFGIKPLVTPIAVEIFSNTKSISIKKAQRILGYKPKISYRQAMNNIKIWIQN